MSRALERHHRDEARVIPVILRPCDWKRTPFGGLMAVPEDGKPVVKHATLDDGFLEVAQAIRRATDAANTRSPVAEPAVPAAARADTAQPGPRSSNLRIRTEFTDRDRHAFLGESFEYVARYFENSMSELQARNERLETDFRQVDANRFEARAFVSGEERAVCGIWRGGTLGLDGIYYSSGGLGNGNGFKRVDVGVRRRLHVVSQASGNGAFRTSRRRPAHYGGGRRILLELVRRTAQVNLPRVASAPSVTNRTQSPPPGFDPRSSPPDPWTASPPYPVPSRHPARPRHDDPLPD